MEFVYVVPRGELFPDHYPQGLVPFGESYPRARFEELVRERGFFVEREYAERTPTLKQIIPYCVVVSNGRVLLLRRTKGGGEARLHDKLSIGVGGHIEPIDASQSNPGPGRTCARVDPIPAATRRELTEEIHIGDFQRSVFGLINDDSNPVGAVHLGIAQVVSTDFPVTIREADQLSGQLVEPGELQALLEKGAELETWSELLIRNLPSVLSKDVPPQPTRARASRKGVGSL